jgi:S1-C subfamily serine protease
MRTRPLILTFCVLLASSAGAVAAAPEDSVVKVTATVAYPNPIRPWSKGTAGDVAGSGVVIEGNKILTCAHLVMYTREVSVQPRAGGDKVEAKVQWLDPDVDLAVLTVKDDDLFKKSPPLARAKELPKAQDNVTVYGFPVGGSNLSVTKGVISRIDHGLFYNLRAGMIIQISAAVNPGNSGGPAAVGGKMIGLVYSRLNDAENIGYIVPNEEVDAFLQRARDGRRDGKPVEAVELSFQSLENEALRRMLKLDKKARGILAVPPERRGPDYPFQEFDILTRIGDYPINNQGMVSLENDTRVLFLCLIPRLARGGAVPVTVLRGGRPVAVSLPVTTRDNRLIREYQGEQPSYFIHGPLVFSPAKTDAIPLYARLSPGLYGSNSPLVTRRFDRVRFPGEEVVVITAPMFDHKIAKGYGDPVGKAVKDVNGVRVKNLSHLVETLRDCKDEFLKFRFADEGSEVLVFDRKEMEAATREILEENGIAESRRASKDVLAVWNKGAAGRR